MAAGSPSPAACMVACTPRSGSSYAGRQQRRRRGQPPHRGQLPEPARRSSCACHAEGTESVPRQCTRGHQLLPGLKGRGAARGTQHPAAGNCRGTSPFQDSAVPAAEAQPRMAEPEKLQERFFCRAAAEDRQAGATSPNCCFLQFFAGVRWVLAPPMPASSPRSRGTPPADISA